MCSPQAADWYQSEDWGIGRREGKHSSEVGDRDAEEGAAAILWGSCDWVQAGAFPSVFVSLF